MNPDPIDFSNLRSASDWLGSMHDQALWEALRLEIAAEKLALSHPAP